MYVLKCLTYIQILESLRTLKREIAIFAILKENKASFIQISVQSAAAGHVHQNSSAHVARSGHLDAAAVLAHGSPQRPIGRCSQMNEALDRNLSDGFFTCHKAFGLCFIYLKSTQSVFMVKVRLDKILAIAMIFYLLGQNSLPYNVRGIRFSKEALFLSSSEFYWAYFWLIFCLNFCSSI